MADFPESLLLFENSDAERLILAILTRQVKDHRSQIGSRVEAEG